LAARSPEAPAPAAGARGNSVASVPSPAPAPAHQLTPDREAEADRALGVLLDTALEPIVDMVLLARDGAYEALSHDGPRN
jgi:hypothetical protein